MKAALVLDSSAMVALFDAYPPVYRLWERADRGERILTFPAAAIAEANGQLRATQNAWDAVLFPQHIVTISLDPHVAVEIGPWPGGISLRHVVYEARASRGAVVTMNPDDYKGHAVLVLPI